MIGLDPVSLGEALRTLPVEQDLPAAWVELLERLDGEETEDREDEC